MDHLDDADLAALARDVTPRVPAVVTALEHLAGCPSCQARREGWQSLAAACRTVSAELDAPLTVPPFEVLARALPAAPPAPAVTAASAVPTASDGPVAAAGTATWRPVPAWTLLRSVRIVLAVALAQVTHLPRHRFPLVVAGLLGALATAVLGGRDDVRLFGALVTLVIQLGALSACSDRIEPRRELLRTLPVGPSAVFAARLTVVLTADTLLAVVSSAAVLPFTATQGLLPVVTTWLGPALLSSAVVAVGATARSGAVGAAAGVTVWALGTLLTLGAPGLARGLAGPLAAVWGTTPLALVLAGVLFATATVTVRRPLPGAPGPGALG